MVNMIVSGTIAFILSQLNVNPDTKKAWITVIIITVMTVLFFWFSEVRVLFGNPYKQANKRFYEERNIVPPKKEKFPVGIWGDQWKRENVMISF